VVKTPSHLFPVRDFTHPQVKKGRGGPAPPPDPDRVHPCQGTQGGTPLPFSGTGLRRRLNSGHRPERGSGGGPPGFHERGTPTPLSSQWEGGATLGTFGGVTRSGSGGRGEATLPFFTGGARSRLMLAYTKVVERLLHNSIKITHLKKHTIFLSLTNFQRDL